MNRVAGLFELADDEFIQLRTLRDAQNEIDRKKLSEGDHKTPLTLETIEHILQTDKHKSMILKQAREAGFMFDDAPHYPHEDIDEGYNDYIPELIEICESNSISTVAKFKKILAVPARKYYNDIITDNRRKHSSHWYSSLYFSALLQFLRINPTDSYYQGWNEDTRRLVLSLIHI